MKIIILFLIIMMYKCFFNSNLLYANEHLVSRQHFLSEVTDFYFSENTLNIKGWAFKRRGYHYKKDSKHQYILHLVAQKHYQFKLNRVDTDLTSIMEYRGAPFCEKVFNELCNYFFTSVGFKGELNLTNIEPGTYKVLLELRQPDNEQITTQLFLDHSYESAMTSDGISYKSNGILDNGRLKIIYHTLLAAKKPLPSWLGGIYQAKHSCDEYFDTDTFFQQDSVFNHIKSKKRYLNLLTYFEVGVQEGTCVNGRRRVIPGNEGTSFVPSTYVDFIGEGLMITKNAHSLLHLDNIIINQYDIYNREKGVNFVSDASKKHWILHKDNTNTSIPGKYETCYIKKSDNKMLCRTVTVMPIQTSFRFVSKSSYRHLRYLGWMFDRIKHIYNA